MSTARHAVHSRSMFFVAASIVALAVTGLVSWWRGDSGRARIGTKR